MSKIEWIITEANDEGFYPTEQAVQRVLEGNPPEFFEDALVDFIELASEEWESQKQPSSISG